MICKAFIDVDAAPGGDGNEERDDSDDQAAAEQADHLRHLLGRHAGQPEIQAGHERRETGEEAQHGFAKEVDALPDSDGDQPGAEGNEGAEQGWQKDIGRIEADQPLFERDALANGDDRGGDQRDARRVEHQEHDHRVARRILLRIDFLQLAHGFEAERRCRVVEAEHVGAGIHDDAAAGRMAGRNVGKNAAEEGGDEAAEEFDEPTPFADFHDAQPQAHDADQAKRDVEAGLGRIEQAGQHTRKNIEIALQQLRHRGNKADEDEGDPDFIEHRRLTAG